VRKDQILDNNRPDGNGTQVTIEEISTLMSFAYEQLGPVPEDHALAQAGLENGGGIVLDYVDHKVTKIYPPEGQLWVFFTCHEGRQPGQEEPVD
jgi:hypothetical protein